MNPFTPRDTPATAPAPPFELGRKAASEWPQARPGRSVLHAPVLLYINGSREGTADRPGGVPRANAFVS